MPLQNIFSLVPQVRFVCFFHMISQGLVKSIVNIYQDTGELGDSGKGKHAVLLLILCVHPKAWINCSIRFEARPELPSGNIIPWSIQQDH